MTANDCIQTLGGIGYTWEHDAHLYYRRALSLRALLGPSTRWREQVAAAARLAAAQAGRASSCQTAMPSSAPGVRAELAEISKLTGAERTRALAAGGWVLPHLPRPWGRDAKPLEQIVIDAELRAADIRPHNLAIGAWVVPALIQYGTPEQQERFLPATMRMDYLWCQLFSEPGAGSDLAGLTTRAERVDGGWRDHRAEDLDLAGQAGRLGHLPGQDRSGRTQARRDQLLPGRHALARDRGAAAARDYRGRIVQPGFS